jgi:diaminobutyrate-2-oxoglutarate transaminase
MNVAEKIGRTDRSVDSATFDQHESRVRSYCRDFPAVFAKALGVRVWDENGHEYLDFLSGAGVLNYGHNHPELRSALSAYLDSNGITHSLDLFTTAKRTFLETFQEVILRPRNLDYRVQFTGPTGTNSVEAALKLARKVTGRTNVVAFTNAFHGMSLGALSTSATLIKRAGAGIQLGGVTRLPFDGYLGDQFDTAALLRDLLEDPGSGIDPPAAIILETVQAEGGVRVARSEWLRAVADIAHRNGSLLIVDEIQTGCGRTGTFFSFERAGIQPDLVCVSKAIGGYGMPLALLLIKPQFDVWKPGEHNGTFRGNNLAFVAGTAALRLWQHGDLARELEPKGNLLGDRLARIARIGDATPRGIGLLRGLCWKDADIAPHISRRAFSRGLIVETCGARHDVLKLLPPITISIDELNAGLDILEHVVKESLGARQWHAEVVPAPAS